MVRSGELQRAEAAVHPHRHILTRALGVSDDVVRRPLADPAGPGGPVPAVQRRPDQRARRRPDGRGPGHRSDPQDAADLLVRAARTHGGSDNITVVVVDVVMGEDDADVGTGGGRGRRRLPERVARRAGGGTGRRGRSRDVTTTSRCCRGPSRSGRSSATAWRARRKAQRVARGRRLITFRTVLFVVILAAILVGAYFAVRWYDTNSYYVQIHDNELMIYQGRIGGGVLWYKPVRGGTHRGHHRRRPASTRCPAPGRRPGGLARWPPGATWPTWSPRSPAAARRSATPTTRRSHADVVRRPPPRPRGPLMERRIRRLGDLHGALLRRPVRPAQQHPDAEGQLVWPTRPTTRGSSAVERRQTPRRHPLVRRGRPGQLGARPPGSVYKYQRVYNPYTAVLFSQIVGFDSIIYGNVPGVEAEYNSYLQSHTRPAKTLAGPADQPDRGLDNVTLTVNDQAAEPGGQGRRRHQRERRRHRRPAAVVLDVEDRGHRGHVLATRPTTPTRWCPRTRRPRSTPGPPSTQPSARARWCPAPSRRLPARVDASRW